MSSDRRSRPGVPPRRRQSEEDLDEPRQARRDPRRRSAYVPRQDAPQPRRSSARQEPPAGGGRYAPSRQRPQQPPYRTRQPEPDYLYGEDTDDTDDLYGAYDEPYGADDRVIEGEAGHAPSSRQRRSQRGGGQRRQPARDAYADPYADALDDEYDYDERYEDSFIDEDDWYEEEAAAGAYSPRRQRAPRQARSMPRPSISMPRRPNIPRPVMPARVKEAALVQDQTALILVGALLLSAVALALLVMNRVDSLAPGFATHISASGIREAFRSETALWQLPLMSGALLLMNAVLAWILAQYSQFSSRFVLGTSIIVHVLIWAAFFRIAY